MVSDVPALVRELRARLHLTQEQFARRVGVTYSTVNHWENGKRTPQPFLAARLDALKEELDAESEAPASRPASDDPVRRAIERIVDRIVDRVRPQRIILFGSHARGDAGPDSDVDLLVVVEVVGSKRAAQLELRGELRDIEIPKDVLVTTPDAYSWRRDVPGTIEYRADKEGRVLYARP